LYGLNVSGFYYFARKALSWDTRKSLMAGAFFAFQLSSLRISWDLYRNALGLGVLLFTLPLLRELETSKKEFMLFISLSILVVLGHEYAAVIMFAVVLGITMEKFLKGTKDKALRVLASILPALAVFLIGVYFYLNIFPLAFIEANFIDAHDTFEPKPGGLFFLTDYLKLVSTDQHYLSYWDLALHIFSLFILLYLLCIPFISIGFFRDSVLDYWTIILLIGSLDALLTPFCALYAWYRYMLMLVYPFTFYLVNGIWKVLNSQSGGVKGNLKLANIWRKATYGILLSMILLGSLFMAARIGDGGIFYMPTTTSYFPSTMLHNTIPLRDVEESVKAIEWLNTRMNNGSVVLVHCAFTSWMRLHLNSENLMIVYGKDAEDALKAALENNFHTIYLIWWNESIGWYGITIPKNFTSIFKSGRISIFKYSQ